MLHLSAPQGGVRITDVIARECWRYQLTCYFVLKHRGRLGLVPFAVTFGSIALVRMLRWRKANAAHLLWTACKRGWAAWTQGPDQDLVSELSTAAVPAHPSAAMGRLTVPS